MHLTPGCAPSIRINGSMETLACATLTAGETHDIAFECLEDCGAARLRERGDASIGIDDGPDRLRLHAFVSSGTTCLAIRLLPSEVPTLESLGIPQSVAEFAEARHGLVLFAGPTGSGKTTSLAAFVDRMNRRSPRTIITIEDPIEYRIPSRRSLIRQREIETDVPDFESAVRGALRSDPDVIVIGEMRDVGTMSVALAAAETGHLVASTVHTSGVAATVSRIIDAYPPGGRSAICAQLASTLVGICSQRLIPRVGGGRVCAVEVLVVDDAVRAIVRDGKVHMLRNAIVTSRASGMITFEESLASLAYAGEISLESARTCSDRPLELDRSLSVYA